MESVGGDEPFGRQRREMSLFIRAVKPFSRAGRLSADARRFFSLSRFKSSFET
jgi:hypothetical protein